MSHTSKTLPQTAQIGSLIEEAECYLQRKGLKPSTIKSVTDTWKMLIPYMEERNTQLYSSQIGEEYVAQKLEKVGIDFSYEWGQTVNLRIRWLTEYMQTGVIKKRIKLSPSFDSEIGRHLLTFLHRKANSGRFSSYTVEHDRYYLSVFLDYMNKHNICRLSSLTIEVINSFLSSLDISKKSLRHHVIRELRLYLRYLHENDLIAINLSRLLPTDAYRQMERLPSIYTREEINTVCSSIDRCDPLGKRDFAILMFLSRYGLRASDICGLTFDNLSWDECNIHLTQYKTKEPIELPLTGEVGEAIIDYLQSGRPECDDCHVFVQGISPFRPVTTAGVYGIVKKVFRHAGINTTGRKQGPHALRHSLATILLKEKIVLPVITGILGHKNSESTKLYLRLDVENLKQCVLDVPPVEDGFYMQNGGHFYE
ncbi:site-specific integrase [Bacteroides neonati]|uniref:site-specific integrase n=1 Tax=Bacteroides neonati TaxID=1347393 RepID=UPI0005AB6AE5|nr:site-specific integrase [Bacteroides neonati]